MLFFKYRAKAIVATINSMVNQNGACVIAPGAFGFPRLTEVEAVKLTTMLPSMISLQWVVNDELMIVVFAVNPLKAWNVYINMVLNLVPNEETWAAFINGSNMAGMRNNIEEENGIILPPMPDWSTRTNIAPESFVRQVE